MRIAKLAAFSLVVGLVAARAAADCGPYVPPAPPPREPTPPAGDNPANPPATPPSGGPETPGDPDGGPATPSGGDGPTVPSGGGDGAPATGDAPPTDGGPTVGGPATGTDGRGGSGAGGDAGGPSAGAGGDPGTPATGGGARGGAAARDLGSWTYWWALNRASIVDLSARGPSVVVTPGASAGAPEIWREEAHAALSEMLGEKDPEVARDVVLALGKGRDPLDAMLFASIVSDGKRAVGVRQAAATSLGLLGHADDMARASSRRALERTCSDADTPDRLRAACLYALGMRRDAAAVPVLARFAAGGAAAWDAPAAAITGLGLSGCTAAREDLERLLRAPTPASRGETMRRVYAAHGLALLGDRAALPALASAAGDDVADVRRASVLALGALANEFDEEVVRSLAGAMSRDRDRIVRGMAALALGRIGGDAASKSLLRAHAENEASMRSYVALALGLAARASHDEAIARVLRKDLASNPQAELAGAISIALGLAGGADSVPALRALVTDAHDPELRSHAAVALGLLGDTETGAAAVRSLLHVQVPRVQADAALGLGLMASSESVAALAATLNQGTDAGVQAAAALALGRIGGREATKALVAVVRDPSRQALVRRLAINGLGLALDRHGGRATSMAGASLDWCAITPSVIDMVHVQ